ncbi:MAG: divergent polysaccharide deacetylase family protein [Rhodospirillales bacterium]
MAVYAAIVLAALLGGYGAGVVFRDARRGSERSAPSVAEEPPVQLPQWGATEDLPTAMPAIDLEEAPPVQGEAAEPSVDPSASPPWRRYAVASTAVDDGPRVVVVLDDLGLDRRRTLRAIGLRGPLTLSFLPYADGLAEQTRAAREAGHELLMHVGMEPVGETADPGPGALRVGSPAAEIRRLLDGHLDRFAGYVGINNHMGSRFTADVEGMTAVMAVLKDRGLLFLDSLTSSRSVGTAAARRARVPVIERDVFLDNIDDPAAIGDRLAALEGLARRKGHAVAIGHPRDATLEALRGWLETLNEKGLVLVPLSAVVEVEDDDGGGGQANRPQAAERRSPPCQRDPATLPAC